jgi:tetratricopeptide (TPR) repeat protein
LSEIWRYAQPGIRLANTIGVVTALQHHLAYHIDHAVVTAAEADWLAELPKASPGEQEDAARQLRARAASADGDRSQLHLIGLGLAVLGELEEAVSVFVRAGELDPTSNIDTVNAAVALLHTGDAERARLWLAPVAEGDTDLSRVARQLITGIDRAQHVWQRRSRHSTDRPSDPATALANELFQSVAEGGPQAKADLSSLQQLMLRHPADDYYRQTLMFALMANDDIPAAVNQAEILERLPDPTHERHFNVAQVFWFGNQRDRASEHFALAHELATTDEERQDVVSMLEYLHEQDEYIDED